MQQETVKTEPGVNAENKPKAMIVRIKTRPLTADVKTESVVKSEIKTEPTSEVETELKSPSKESSLCQGESDVPSVDHEEQVIGEEVTSRDTPVGTTPSRDETTTENGDKSDVEEGELRHTDLEALRRRGELRYSQDERVNEVLKQLYGAGTNVPAVAEVSVLWG